MVRPARWSTCGREEVIRQIARVAWATLVLLVVAAGHQTAPRAEEPVKIGLILPYSGAYASLADIRLWPQTYKSIIKTISCQS